MKHVVERWRIDYNHYQPDSSLAHITTAAFAELCCQAGEMRVAEHIVTVSAGIEDS
ncbi:MAG: hypothetical protein ACYS9C_00430 [Planctomycetota bacterium]|jgi:hypothetical protein